MQSVELRAAREAELRTLYFACEADRDTAIATLHRLYQADGTPQPGLSGRDAVTATRYLPSGHVRPEIEREDLREALAHEAAEDDRLLGQNFTPEIDPDYQ